MFIQQIISKVLSNSYIYNFSQRIMGAHRGRLDLSTKYIRAQSSDYVIDIGCGTGEILNYLPTVNYYGIDFSQKYIESAKKRFGDRGEFECMSIQHRLPNRFNDKFDIALAIGVLHHLSNDESKFLIETAYHSLKVGGRLITIDPCFDLSQTVLARKIISLDRGKFIRSGDQYRNLFNESRFSPQIFIKNRYWIPYTHCIMECKKC